MLSLSLLPSLTHSLFLSYPGTHSLSLSVTSLQSMSKEIEIDLYSDFTI